MDPNTSRIKDLAVGDLVTHILYGKSGSDDSWI